MARTSHFQRGSGCFACGICGRQTRQTGVQSMNSECCPDCYEIAGIYNVHQDGLPVTDYASQIKALCQNIVSKGGKLDGDALELLQLIGESAPGVAA